MATVNRTATTGSLLLGAPLLLLIGLAILALFVTTSPSDVAAGIHNPAVRDAVWLSLKTTAVSLACVVGFGTGLALAIHRTPKWLAGSIEVLVTLPAIMPPSVAGLALLLAFGRQGLMGDSLNAMGIRIAFTPIAVVMAQIFVATPFYVREVTTALAAIDPSFVEAARLDGAGPRQLASRVMLPIALPFVLGGAILAWARSVGEFGATILFAGNLEGVTQTVPLAIYLGFESDLSQAKALAVLLMIVAIAVLAMLRLTLRRQMSFAH